MGAESRTKKGRSQVGKKPSTVSASAGSTAWKYKLHLRFWPNSKAKELVFHFPTPFNHRIRATFEDIKSQDLLFLRNHPFSPNVVPSQRWTIRNKTLRRQGKSH